MSDAHVLSELIRARAGSAPVRLGLVLGSGLGQRNHNPAQSAARELVHQGGPAMILTIQYLGPQICVDAGDIRALTQFSLGLAGHLSQKMPPAGASFLYFTGFGQPEPLGHRFICF